MGDKQVLNFEVSHSSFNSVVLMNSYKIPVVTLFMSSSDVTSIEMENMLSRYAAEFAGQFLLARVDIDMDADLKEQYQITSAPMIKIFKDANMVHQEVGIVDADDMAAVLKSFGISRAGDGLREEASRLNTQGDTEGAIKKLTEAIQLDPGNVRVALDMTQLLLDINMVEEAVKLFNRLPDSAKNSDQGKLIIGQVTFKNLAAKTPGVESLLKAVEEDSTDIDSKFYLAICYIAERQFDQALEYAFDVLTLEPNYKEGAAQEIIVTVIEMLDLFDTEAATKARRSLANIVSS
ncbi:MAG: tetratricopeptide repeat protein [Pseudomonadota bacterium]|nr:tetratricopeptide repeat protein [Pseudomonadota bacterium]